MTLEELYKKVCTWDRQGAGIADAKYQEIFHRLYHYAHREWRKYLPAEHPDQNPNYMERLAAWVGSATTEDGQKLLLEYATHISFFSHDDFVALYRTALQREVTRWVAMDSNVFLKGNGVQQFNERIMKEIHNNTWFCPITDSMDINEFYKVNNLQGSGHRPSFSTLEMLANGPQKAIPDLAKNVLEYMANPSLDPKYPCPPLKRVVLLEDFVGSSSQCVKALQWAIQSLKVPILFVPLILCPNGVSALRNVERNSNHLLRVRPVIELRRDDILGPERRGAKGWRISLEVENFAKCWATTHSVSNVFGYKNTGCSVATFANTPDNSIPFIYQRIPGQWEPLLPRVHRGEI